MVIDKLQNCEKYVSLHSDFKTAFEYAKSLIVNSNENGTYEIRGKEVYANISSYMTKTDALFEAHEKYIDIQILLSGEEEIHVIDKGGLEVAESYNNEKDYALLKSEQSGTIVSLRAGDFCILYPHEAHKPCIAPEGKIAENRKIVVKIAVE